MTVTLWTNIGRNISWSLHVRAHHVQQGGGQVSAVLLGDRGNSIDKEKAGGGEHITQVPVFVGAGKKNKRPGLDDVRRQVLEPVWFHHL